MKTIKGVILEKSGPFSTVLGTDGSFRRVRSKAGAEIGEEIDIPVGFDFSSLRTLAGVAAVFFLILASTLGWNLWQASTAVAFVSVDINPSLVITLNAKNKVLKIEGRNPEARSLLSQIPAIGQPVKDAVTQVVDQALKMNYLNNEHSWVVVGVSPLPQKQASPELEVSQLAAWVNQAAQSRGFNAQVAVFQLTSQEREQAIQAGLSPGEYALWQNARQAGFDILPQEVTNTTERTRLLDNPSVQAQIQAGKNSIKPVNPPKQMNEQSDMNQPEAGRVPSTDSNTKNPGGNDDQHERLKQEDSKEHKMTPLHKTDSDSDSESKSESESMKTNLSSHGNDLDVPVFSPAQPELKQEDNDHKDMHEDASRKNSGEADDQKEGSKVGSKED